MNFSVRHSAGWLFVFGALTGLLATVGGWTVDAAPLYRWVDENGQVHYSDRLPPDYSLGHDKLNESGRVIDTVEPPKTPEELEAEKQQAALEAQRRERERARTLRDRVLLQTFTTESDLFLLRNDRLAAVDGQLKNAERELAELKEKLATTDDTENQQALRERLARIEVYIEEKRQERREIEARFAADLERYRELKSKTR